MKTILFDKNNMEKWDEFVASCSKGAFTHLSGWGKVYEIYGYRSFPIAAMDDSNRIRGILPLFLMKDIFGRKYLVSNPFLSYGGFCGDDEKIKKALILKAQEIAVHNDVQYVEIRQLADTIDYLQAKNDFVTMFLRLEKGEEFIWKNVLKAKVRNQIRKAIKSGLTIDFGMKHFDNFYRVLAINHRDFGTPLHSKTFLRKVLEEFKDNSGILVVKYRGIVIAGMLYIHCRNVFSEPWASSLRKYNRLCPNNILYWEAIKYACRNGFEYFDFGRSTINCGTYNYKKQWGAEPVQLNYIYHLNKANRPPEHNAHDNKYKVAITIWKKIPMIIADTIGPWVVKHLPEL
jgi:FemAB-related protein (PEP-CTERM system-associated)